MKASRGGRRLRSRKKKVSFPFLQIPLCHGPMFRARNGRSLRDNHIDRSNASVQNLIHNIAAHAVQPEIAGIQNALAVRFDQE